ncbi:hypothetical protein SBY92_000139 [Candida maltosa Xu316]
MNKRSNFQFTYDSENHLLQLIHEYKEDIFTRGNIIKTWEKVLQQFNEHHNTNIVQSRTINHRFQILKKNLENRLKHENQPLEQLSLNENEKLLVDIMDYLYANNYTQFNPYLYGNTVDSSSSSTDRIATTTIPHTHSGVDRDLSVGDISQISPTTFTNKLNQERAQYLMAHDFDPTVQHFNSNIGLSSSLDHENTVQASSNQLNVAKDMVHNFSHHQQLSQSELIDDSQSLHHQQPSQRQPQQENLLQQDTSHHQSPNMMYKPGVNLQSQQQQQQHLGSQSDPHTERQQSTPQQQHQPQPPLPPPPPPPPQQPQPEHRPSDQQPSSNIHYDGNQQQRSINTPINLPYSHPQSQEQALPLLLQQILVSQNQINISINALRDDLRNYKIQTDEKLENMINVQQIQINDRIQQKLNNLMELVERKGFKSNSSSSGDDDMTQEDNSVNTQEQTTSSE